MENICVSSTKKSVIFDLLTDRLVYTFLAIMLITVPLMAFMFESVMDDIVTQEYGTVTNKEYIKSNPDEWHIHIEHGDSKTDCSVSESVYSKVYESMTVGFKIETTPVHGIKTCFSFEIF